MNHIHANTDAGIDTGIDSDTDANNSDATRRYRQRGQATTEYALILLVAAVVAIGVIAWATAGGGAGKIGSLFDSILDAVLSRAESTF